MKRAQMYEFTAESAQEKKKWEDSIENAMNGKCKERQREGKERDMNISISFFERRGREGGRRRRGEEERREREGVCVCVCVRMCVNDLLLGEKEGLRHMYL